MATLSGTKAHRAIQRHPSPRARVGKALVALTAMAVVSLGLWGVLASGATVASQTPARIGEVVEVAEGALRVEQIIPEQMDPMQHQNFANAGMSMSGVVPDMTPEGYRRFAVEVTLFGGGSQGLRYAADQFRLTGEGMEETGALRIQLGDGWVPTGSAVFGTVMFQAPTEASGLLLHFRDGERSTPIAIDLPPATDNHDDH